MSILQKYNNVVGADDDKVTEAAARKVVSKEAEEMGALTVMLASSKMVVGPEALKSAEQDWREAQWCKSSFIVLSPALRAQFDVKYAAARATILQPTHVLREAARTDNWEPLSAEGGAGWLTQLSLKVCMISIEKSLFPHEKQNRV